MKIGLVEMDLAVQSLKIRSATHEDCELLWNWANEPTVREFSFSSELISWEDHVEWFNNKLNSPNCYQFIGLNYQNEPIGQIRFDLDEELQAIISISVARNQRNQGYGKVLIQMGINKLFEYTLVRNIQALIKTDNFASIKLFESLGFKASADMQVISNGSEILALKYVYEVTSMGIPIKRSY